MQRAQPKSLSNRSAGGAVELAWRAEADDRDWVHVTLVVDGTPYDVGMASGPDDDGSGPSGCASAPDKANPAVQVFRCALASRWYAAEVVGDAVVVTRFDEPLEPHRVTSTVVRRIEVR